MKRAAPLSFDANAAAPVQPAAWDAYVEATRHFADPEAPHAAGRAAREALEAARSEVAGVIGAQAGEILFTSGGTEADAAGLLGVLSALHRTSRGREDVASVPHTITSCIEHAAVGTTLKLAVDRGLTTLTELPVPRLGRVAVDAVPQEIGPCTRLVSWVAASNETGVIQPIVEIAAACRARGVLVHTDAVQAMGRMPVDVRTWGVDLLSFSGHKLGAVGGVGVLYRRSGTPCEPLLPGGHETPNVAGAASLAAALKALPTTEDLRALAALRDAFEATMRHAVPALEIIGESAPRLPNTSCLRFPGCEGDGLLMALDVAGFALSTGSACSSGSIEPSPILLGMGFTPKEALETLRISLGHGTRPEDVNALAEHLARAVRASLKGRSPNS